MSKMIQGIMMTKKQTFPPGKKDIMNKLIAHEAQRVFKDRLIDENDYRLFDEILIKILKDDLHINAEEMQHIFSEVGVIFCNFNRPDKI